MRALAVVLVVWFHVGLFVPSVALTGGFVGVDVFFVISGFVITRVLLADRPLAQRMEAGRLDLPRFYVRRAQRILPALALTTTATMLGAALLGPMAGFERTVGTGSAAALSLANVELLVTDTAGYFAPSSESNALLNLWSLSLEEQFYLLFPLLMALSLWVGWRAHRSAARPGRASLVLAVAAVASFATCIHFTGQAGVGTDTGDIAFYLPIPRAWEFIVGALVAIHEQRFSRLGRNVAAIAVVGGLATVVAASLLLDASTSFPGLAALAPVLGAAAMIVGGTAEEGPLAPVLASQPARWLGAHSYGWYLWHWPAVVFAAALFPGDATAAPTGAVVGLGLAWVTRRHLEHPIRIRALDRRQVLVLTGTCVAVPLLTAALLAQVADPEATMSQAFTAGSAKQEGCAEVVELDAQLSEACHHPLPGATGRAVLVGDSNAGHLYEGFVLAAHEAGLDASVAVQSGCPVVDLTISSSDRGADADCATYVDSVRSALRVAPPEVVVLAAATDTYLEGDTYRIADPSTGEPVPRSERADAWSAGLTRVAADLSSQDVEVIVVGTPPRFPDWSPGRCAAIRWHLAPDTCGAEVGRDQALAARAEAIEADRLATASGAGTWVDPFDLLCPGDPCTALDPDGTWTFRDSHHLSVAGSLRTAEVLGPAMAASR